MGDGNRRGVWDSEGNVPERRTENRLDSPATRGDERRDAPATRGDERRDAPATRGDERRDAPATRGDERRDAPATRRDSERESPGPVESSPLGGAIVAGGAFGATAAGGGPVTVETDAVTATLVGVPLVDVRELAYTHRIDRARLEAGETSQPVALFDLHNASGVPVQWVGSRTQFIGGDGYTYRPAQLPIDPAQLGPGIHTRRVEVQPGRRARIATLVEQLPAGVGVAEVVQTVSVRAGGTETERLRFTLAD